MATKNLSTPVVAFVLIGLVLSACVRAQPDVLGTPSQPSPAQVLNR